MVNEEYLKVIERQNPLFIGVISLQSIFEILLEAGVVDKNAIEASFKKDTYTFYFSKKALDSVNAYLISLIKDKNSKIQEFYEKGLYWNKKADEWVVKSEEGKLLFNADTFQGVRKDLRQIFQYSTVMPWWILLSINTAIENGEEKSAYEATIKIFEELRGQTKYPQFFESVIERYFEVSLSDNNIDKNLLPFITPYEFSKLLAGEAVVTAQELEKRKNFCVIEIVSDNEDDVIFTYDESYLKYHRNINLDSIRELKGNIAYKGFAKGCVKIVNSVSDMHKINEGDILVSFNTNPSLTPAIIKSSAIISDDGGIMSHAAIIARELKKPCIIGTKIATQVLKDGDMVEVDANNGIVKILNT